MTATPASGWRFVQWGGSISSTSSTVSFALDSSKSLTAFFEQIPLPPPKQGTELPDCPTSPILIDLDGNGFHLVGGEDTIVFDIDGDGRPNAISWTAAGARDAFLTLDRDENGIIDDGTELFGTVTPLFGGGVAPNGYVALAEFDEVARGGNGDGVISSTDAVWNSLQLWTDSNHNGVSEEGELGSLVDGGVIVLDLHYVESQRRDRHGNWFRYKSKVTLLNAAGREHASEGYDVSSG